MKTNLEQLKEITASLEQARSEAEYFFEKSPDLLCVASLNGQIIKVNPNAWKRILGYDETELLGRSFLEFVIAEDQERTVMAMRNIVHSEQFSFYNRYKHKNGKSISLEWTSSRWDGKSGKTYAIARQTDSMFRGFIEDAVDIVLLVNDKGIILMANTRTFSAFGYNPEELIGQEIEILVPDMLKKKHKVLRTEYFEHPTGRELYARTGLRGRRKDGSEVEARVSLTPIHSTATTHILVVMHPIENQPNDIST